MTDALVLQVHVVPGTSQTDQELADLYWRTAPTRAGQQVSFAHSVNDLAAKYHLERLSTQVGQVAHVPAALAAVFTVACASPRK